MTTSSDVYEGTIYRAGRRGPSAGLGSAARRALSAAVSKSGGTRDRRTVAIRYATISAAVLGVLGAGAILGAVLGLSGASPFGVQGTATLLGLGLIGAGGSVLLLGLIFGHRRNS